MPLRQLLEILDSEEISELMIVDRLYGIIPDPWRQTGRTCAVIANCMGSGKTKYTDDDFMNIDHRPHVQSAEEIKSRLLTFAKAHNAGIVPK